MINKVSDFLELTFYNSVKIGNWEDNNSKKVYVQTSQIEYFIKYENSTKIVLRSGSSFEVHENLVEFFHYKIRKNINT